MDAACASAWLAMETRGALPGLHGNADGTEIAGLLSRRLPFLRLSNPANDEGRTPDLAVRNLTRQALADAPSPF